MLANRLHREAGAHRNALDRLLAIAESLARGGHFHGIERASLQVLDDHHLDLASLVEISDEYRHRFQAGAPAGDQPPMTSDHQPGRRDHDRLQQAEGSDRFCELLHLRIRIGDKAPRIQGIGGNLVDIAHLDDLVGRGRDGVCH